MKLPWKPRELAKIGELHVPTPYTQPLLGDVVLLAVQYMEHKKNGDGIGLMIFTKADAYRVGPQAELDVSLGLITRMFADIVNDISSATYRNEEDNQ